jgi:hypothetical protein
MIIKITKDQIQGEERNVNDQPEETGFATAAGDSTLCQRAPEMFRSLPAR